MTIIERADIGASSLLEEEGGAPDVTERYSVDVRRFDVLFPTFDRPALCKIDVQGSEMMVLRGTTGVVGSLDFLIVEVSTIATVIDGPEVAQVISLLDELGFSLYDILSFARRPLDGALAQADFVFVPHDSPLRSDRRWDAQ